MHSASVLLVLIFELVMLGGGYSIGFTKVSAQRMLTFDKHHVSTWCAKKSCVWVGCCCLEFSASVVVIPWKSGL